MIEFLVLSLFAGVMLVPYFALRIRRERNQGIKTIRALPREQRLAYLQAYNTGKLGSRKISVEEVY